MYSLEIFLPWGPFFVGHFNVSFADLVAHFKPINFLLKKKKTTLPVCLYIHCPDKDSHKSAPNLLNPSAENSQN